MGEIGDWYLTGIRLCSTLNSPNTTHSCLHVGLGENRSECLKASFSSRLSTMATCKVSRKSKNMLYKDQGEAFYFLNYRSFSERQTNFLFYVFDLQGDKLASQNASRKYKLFSVRNLMQSAWPQWASFTIMRSSYTWRILAGHWTIKLGIQMADHNTFGTLLIYCLADAIEKMGIHGWRSATSAQRRFSSRYSRCLSICFPTLFCLSEIVERDSCWINKRKKATGRVEVLEKWVFLKCLISGARATYA